VSIPLAESAAYDLLVDDGKTIHRVQCKYASTKEVDLRRIHSNSGGYVTKVVLDNAYDWLYVLRPDGLSTWSSIAMRGAVRSRPRQSTE